MYYPFYYSFFSFFFNVSGTIYHLVQFFLIMLIILTFSSLLTVLERKGLASSQRRIGPTYNGWYGLVQIIQDGIKLIYKQFSLNHNLNHKFLFISSILHFSLSYFLFLFIYIDLVLFFNFTFLLLIVILLFIINHFTITLCAFFIHYSKWTILSSIRLIILFFIYDINFFLVLLILLPNSHLGIDNLLINQFFNINFYYISSTNHLLQFPILLFTFFFLILIESGRIPIDLLEAESEFIAGYSIEFSGFLYALFASAEYSSFLFHSFLVSILFIQLSFLFITLVLATFILIRSTLPRVIYTHIFTFTFHYILPFTVITFLFILFIWTLNSLLFLINILL